VLAVQATHDSPIAAYVGSYKGSEALGDGAALRAAHLVADLCFRSDSPLPAVAEYWANPLCPHSAQHRGGPVGGHCPDLLTEEIEQKVQDLTISGNVLWRGQRPQPSVFAMGQSLKLLGMGAEVVERLKGAFGMSGSATPACAS